jgi:hypothetical protein
MQTAKVMNKNFHIISITCVEWLGGSSEGGFQQWERKRFYPVKKFMGLGITIIQNRLRHGSKIERA